MTLFNEKRFAEWLPADFDGVFHWGFLQGCFPRQSIEPHDFDAVVEIGGNFLQFETKADNARISGGRRDTINALLENPRWTVFIVFGKQAKEITRLIILDGIGNPVDINPATVEDVRRATQDWAKRREWFRVKRLEQKH